MSGHDRPDLRAQEPCPAAAGQPGKKSLNFSLSGKKSLNFSLSGKKFAKFFPIDFFE
jgi:hypothetical protein